MGSSKTSGTTKTVSEPWGDQKPYLSGGSAERYGWNIPGVFPEAAQMYLSGGMSPEYYQGGTVAGQSPYTQNAIKMQAERAMNGNQLMNDLTGAANSIFTGQSFWNDADKNGYDTLKNLADSPNMQNGISGNTGYDILTRLAGSKGTAGIEGNSGLDTLKQLMAENDMAGIKGNTALEQLTGMGDANAENPWLDKMYQRANSQQQAALNSQFSGSGRYGSGAHTASAADASGNLAADIYGNAYENDANRRLQANQSAAQLYGNYADAGAERQSNNAQSYANMWGTFDQNNADRQLNAATNSGNLYNSAMQSNADRQLDAAKSAGGLWNDYVGTIAGNLGAGQSLANQGYTDAAMLGEAGSALDDYNQNLINADIDRWNYNQNRDLQALSNYNQFIQGNYGGTSTSTGKTNGGSGSRVGGLLGGALAGAGIGSSIGGPAGGAIGAGLGGLAGLF